MSVEVIKTISPTTNEPILTRNGASQSDLELLPKVATEAFQSFRKTTLKERQDIVKKFLGILSKHQDELAEELTVQMGRPIAFGSKEVATAVKRGEYLLKISDEVLKDTDGEPEKGFKRFIRKVPVGPVLILFAWNVSATSPIPIGDSADVSVVPVPDPREFTHPGHSGWQLCDPQAVSPDPDHCGAGGPVLLRGGPA